MKHHLHSALERSIIEGENDRVPSKIERKVSMIIFLVEKINVNCSYDNNERLPLQSTYFGPPKIFDMVNILAHSSSASTIARA